MIRSVDVEELVKILDKKKDLNLLDVRRKGDYEASPKKIPGATWLDPEEVDTWIDLQSGEKPSVVYCVKGGGVSQSIAEKMQNKGIDTAFLAGGIKAWAENGGLVK